MCLSCLAFTSTKVPFELSEQVILLSEGHDTNFSSLVCFFFNKILQNVIFNSFKLADQTFDGKCVKRKPVFLNVKKLINKSKWWFSFETTMILLNIFIDTFE